MLGGKKEVRGERCFFTDSRYLGWGVDIDLWFFDVGCWKGVWRDEVYVCTALWVRVW